MASQGPYNPASGIDDASIGSISWSSPGNIISSDDARATTLTGPGTTHYLKANGFNSFNIPSGSIINGILFDVERNSSSGGGGNTNDNKVYVIKNGIIQTTENKASGVNWPNSDTYIGYGGPNDLWGLTWNYSDINQSFGFVISATLGFVPAATIDHIRATVFYTPANSGANNNLTLYISGSAVVNNISLFEQGLDVKNNNINLFELGQDSSSNNIPLFISSFNNSNNTFTLFEQGYNIINNNIPLFISSLNINNNNFPLYIGGIQDLNNLLPFPLFEQGYLPYNNNLPLFIYGHGLITNLNPPLNLPLYVSGNTVNDFTNYFPLFIGGYTNFDNLIPGFTLFEQGDLLIASGLPLYVNGQQNFTSTTPPPNILPLYIAGPLTPTGYIPLYISGPQLVRMCQFTRYINMVTRVNLEI